ncbi:class Ib ribonucleoside-diphosphate reductase assembly flavoprotein NrdI [Parapedobacter koreensis]|uniref:Protein involved in ribonucleotide reduction n=1 Tax=Parapedobacter koreensis TaxID=332977 RepID=A0A1H7F6I4_9SPHI|nr:class Ib ribonucleoside-diphosphate reductase assembly flavoprotein NrdI [Parapedobacter koreensis]SEK21007.1 protein involved in ribonucleotide reduction [Parapedobacter koreensis]
MERIYYDSKTGNVERFMQKVSELTGWTVQKIQPGMDVEQAGHLVTFTTRFGEIPDTTKAFLQHASSYLLSVSSSGNQNWGRNFAVAGDKIATEYGIPLALKFELSGTNEDVNEFIAIIKARKHHDNKRRSKELDFAQ